MSHVKEQGTIEQRRTLEAAGWMWAQSGGWMAPTPDSRFDGKFWSADDAIAEQARRAERGHA